MSSIQVELKSKSTPYVDQQMKTDTPMEHQEGPTPLNMQEGPTPLNMQEESK